MRILFLSRWFPFPANNGSKLRILSLLKGLAPEHEVTLISFFAPQEGSPDVQGLEALCQKVIPIAHKNFDPHSLKSRLGFLSPTPRSVIDTYSNEVEATIRSELTTDSYDLVIASQFDMALYARNFKGLPAVFEEAEVGIYLDRYKNAGTARERLRHGLTWAEAQPLSGGSIRSIFGLYSCLGT
jgi:polysaccharide biosynthesis protein PslH